MNCPMVRVCTDSPKHVPNLAGMHGPRMFGSMFGASRPGALREGNWRGLKRQKRKVAHDCYDCINDVTMQGNFAWSDIDGRGNFGILRDRTALCESAKFELMSGMERSGVSALPQRGWAS